MKLGLGTGSTVTFLVDALGKRIKEENLNITTVSTSSRTKRQAESLGIKVVDLNDIDELDLTIDGADQISPDYQGIKGGGAAHTLEKKLLQLPQNAIYGLLMKVKLLNHSVLSLYPLKF